MGLKTRKVVLIGAGHVGSHCAYALAVQGIADEIVLVDLNEKKADAQAQDIADIGCYLPHHIECRAGSYSDSRDADIVVICAGPLPAVNQSRLDTLADTVACIGGAIGPIVASGFSGVFVVISNPCDVIAQYVWRKSGFPKNRIIATSTALDSARLRRALSDATGIDSKSIEAFSMGEHGASQMVPWSQVRLCGKSLARWMEERPDTFGRLDLREIRDRAATVGYTILGGKGSTEFGIGTALAEIAKAIFHNEHKMLPVSVGLEGEYGQRGIFASVPCILGGDGVEEIVQIEMTGEERALFDASCSVIRDYTERAASL